MARKKKTPTEPPQENVDNSDDTFGLPEVEYEPLKRDEPVKTDEPEVVIINEAPQVTPEPEPTPPPVEPPSVEPPPPFEFKEPEPVKEEEVREKLFEERHSFEDEHQPYQPTYSYQREESEMWPKVLGILLVLILAGAAVWYFGFYRPEQLAAEERERKEIQEAQDEARREQEERLAAAKRAEDERAAAASKAAAAKPITGGIETLSGRSGRYYVVIASSIDGDLIMDYAKKLSAKGVSSKIIPPFGKSKFHRLAVAEGDTYEVTQTTADGMKGGDYGDKIWVVKY
jgi:hypothetical protein